MSETGSSWRDHAREVIDEIVKEHGTHDLDALEKAIRAAYPFGLREHWPYKVWSDEVRKTMKRLRSDRSHGEQLPLFGGQP